mgnify:CR=1 FL=1
MIRCDDCYAINGGIVRVQVDGVYRIGNRA